MPSPGEQPVLTFAGPTFPTLPNIETPQCALAEAHQRKSAATNDAPRGLAARILPSTPISRNVPHDSAALWFKEVYAGYMTAQAVGYCSHMTDALKLFSAESTELSAAYHLPKPFTGEFTDDSLPPRRVGVWILSKPHDRALTVESYLDAFAHWADSRVNGERVCSRMRMSAAFGTDADFLCQQLKAECLWDGPQDTEMSATDIRLAIRWHDGNRMCCVFRELGTQAMGNNCIRTLQDEVVRASGVYNISLPEVCMKPAPESVTQNAFYVHNTNTSNGFFDMLQGTPSITRSKVALEGAELKSTNIFVRVAGKHLGADKIDDTSCFHGVLLSVADKELDAIKFAQQSDQMGLRMPLSKDELAIGLHLCAVQAEGLEMRRLVSLYGTFGIAGKPIHTPLSWVWVARPAIRPVDAMLLNAFSLFPCSKESVIPKRPELVDPFNRFWSITSTIFRMLRANRSDIVTNKSFESVSTARAPSPNDIDETPATREEMFMAAALQVNLLSERTTLGDAYGQLVRMAGPTAVTANMKQAMAALGVRASLYDMFTYNETAAAALRDNDGYGATERNVLHELCDVALESVHQSKKARKEEVEPLAVPSDQMRRMLAACGRKKGGHVTLDRNFRDSRYCTPMIATVTAAIGVRITERPVLALMHRTLKRLESDTETEWGELAQQVIGSAGCTAVLAACKITSLFLIVSKLGTEEIRVKHVEADGRLSDSTLDRLIRIKDPCVIILQRVDDDKVRVTATVA